MASSGQDDIGAASVSAVEAAASAGDEDGATGEGNNNNNNTTTGTTATTMASTTWAQAREASTHMVLQSALEDLETRASKHQEELIRTREKAASAERAHLASQAKVEDLQRTLLEKTEALEKLRLVYEAESAKTSLQKESYTALEERMDRLQIESDSLREEISRLVQSNDSYKKQLAQAEALAKLDDSSIVPLQFQVQRLTTEMDNLQTHSGWLEQELRSKTEDLVSVKSAHASEMSQLRAEIDATNTDREEVSAENQQLRKQLDALQKKTESLSNQVRDATQDAIDTKLSSEEELSASRRLASLQKEQLERIQQRYDGMVTQMVQLKELATSAENEGHERWREQERQLQATAKQALKEQADEYDRHLEAMRQQVNDANNRRKRAEDGLLLAETPATIEADGTTTGQLLALPPSVGPGTGATDDDDGPLTLTDLYARVAKAESVANAEKLKRKKTEILFSRLEAEIQAKAPMLIRQRQEYELAMERQAEYKKRMESALDEASAARNESSTLQSELGRLNTKNKDLTQECKELAKQVQQMLIARSTETTNPTVPQTVAQMQGANQRLLLEYKRLTDKNKELEQRLEDADLSQQVESYKREVASLKEARRRQEVMVESIVQQRDLYRTLLNKQDTNILGGVDETSALEIVKRQSNRSKVLEEEHRKLSNDLANAQGQLAALTRDKDIAMERFQRYEVLNAELNTSLDRLQLEVSSGKAAVARSEADGNYHKDKAVRLEETMQRGRQEIEHLTSAKNRLVQINSELEMAVSKANAESSKLDGELRQAKSKLLMVETQAEAAKAAERRLVDESNQLRNEIARQGTMIESIQRIEASLASRSNNDMESYKLEIVSLKEKYAAAKKSYLTEVEDLKGKTAAQEIHIKELDDGRAKAAMEALNAKKESLEALTKVQEMTERASSLESQLKVAKKKLGEVDSDDPDTETVLKGKISALEADLANAKVEIASLTEQAATYKRLANESESAMTDMTQSANAATKVYTVEIAKLKEELEHANAEMTKRMAVITDLTNDLASQRAEREKAVNEVKNEVSALKASVAELKGRADDSESRYILVQNQAMILRDDLAKSQSNYERELGLHATARTELRIAREEAENDSRLRKSAEQDVSRLEGELELQRSLLATEQSKREQTIKEYEKNLEETRSQNSILHGQLETINDQIEKMQLRRLVAADEDDESKTPSGVEEDEVSALRLTVMELRELVKFVRSEKDAIQGQLDASRRATEREKAQLAITKRNLDEARAELKVFQESTVDTVSGASSDVALFKEKLGAAEEQCRLLRDSNSHLQQHVLKLEENLSIVRSELEQSKTESLPAKQIQRDLESDKAALLSEKESLLREIDDWKGRVQSLVSTFNQVDPEEHAKVVKNAEELKKQIATLETSKSEAEDEAKRIRALASRASSQLQTNKQLVENQKKMIAKLTADKEAMAKSQNDAASKKEVDELKEKILKVEKDRDDEKIQLKGASEMNEKLRERLRQFQKIIVDLKKKEATLTSELKQAEAKLKDSLGEVTKLSSGLPAEVEVASQSAEVKAPEKSAVEKSKGEEKADPMAENSKLSAGGEPSETKAETKVQSAIPKVPPGGFKFGPSETKGGAIPVVEESTGQPAASVAAKGASVPEKKYDASTSKKRSAEQSETDGPDRKKTVDEGQTASNQSAGDTSLSEAIVHGAPPTGASTSSEPSAARKMSGDKKELSMKELLLEKKRKLMETMKKAKEEKLKQQQQQLQQQQASDTPPEAPVEPEAKRTKVDEREKTQNETPIPTKAKAESAVLDPAAIPFVPSKVMDVPTTTPDNGTEEAEEGEMDETEAADSKVEPRPNVAPPATFAASPFGTGGGAPTPFGSGFGTGAPLTFGQASSFGTSGGFGSGTSSMQGTVSAFGASAFGGGQNTGEGGGASSSGFGSGAFLNMKPPGTSSVPVQFSFGTSSSITLPTPAAISPQTSMFNAFAAPPANPFGGGGQSSTTSSSSIPLFGVVKNAAKDDSKDDEAEEGEMPPDSEGKN